MTKIRTDKLIRLLRVIQNQDLKTCSLVPQSAVLPTVSSCLSWFTTAAHLAVSSPYWFSGSGGKEPACHCRRHKEMQVQSLDLEEPLEEGMATHSSILAWRTPRTEEPGGLQSMGSHRVGHDWSDLAQHSLSRFQNLLKPGANADSPTKGSLVEIVHCYLDLYYPQPNK